MNIRCCLWERTGIARAERDGTRAVTRFRLSPKRTSPFKSVGASVQSTAGSRGVRISFGNAGYTTFGGGVRVLTTHSIRQFPLHFPSREAPCATRFRTSSTFEASPHTFQGRDRIVCQLLCTHPRMRYFYIPRDAPRRYLRKLHMSVPRKFKPYIKLMCVFVNVVVSCSLNEMYAATVALCRSNLTNSHVGHLGTDDHTMLKR